MIPQYDTQPRHLTLLIWFIQFEFWCTNVRDVATDSAYYQTGFMEGAD